MKQISKTCRVMGSLAVCSLIALNGPTGCSTVYYAAWQKLGYEKRDILVSRVKEARDDQTEAKAQFKSTLDELKALNNFDGGKLEEEYKKLKGSYESCEDRAAAVSKKIASVNKVANDMFDEWSSELKDYGDPKLREASGQKLNDSKARYAQLYAVMQNSEAKMQPVLAAFKDRVHFLRDNLNAAAISSLQGTSAGIDTDVQSLIQDMDASINEANAFIDNMNKS